MKEWIGGRNPVFETLNARRRNFFRLLLARGVEEKGRITEILRLSAARRLVVERVPRQQIDGLIENNQGVALETSAYPYSDLPQIIELARQREEDLFILALDVLQDPQNLGTLLRTAEAVGVHGALLPLRQTALVTPAVVHSSSGACEHMLVAQSNMAQGLKELKDAGAWVIGLDGGPGSRPISEINLKGPLVLVVGSEGEGMRELVRRSCDALVNLPMRGKVESLNAAVAGSVALYLALSNR